MRWIQAANDLMACKVASAIDPSVRIQASDRLWMRAPIKEGRLILYDG